MLRSALIAATMLLVTAPAAASNAIVNFSAGCDFRGYSSDETIGWGFSAANAIKVTALGWWVQNTQLVANHEVGIWSDAGALLGNVTVTPGAATSGGFRFASVSPFTLAAGNYRIGGRERTNDGDRYGTCVDSPTLAVGITMTSFARSADGSGFTFPGIVDPDTSFASYGPNFQFSPASVPEPASWAMLIAGFGLVGALARRRRAVVTA